ncbi:integrase [Halorubrum sp. RMP-47]|uniref:Integrase n=1 Tax=Halorubrum miltondacostae TaxID=3076378 RepID=A0ABD5M9Z3_9EURY
MAQPPEGPQPGGTTAETPLDEPLPNFFDAKAKTIDESTSADGTTQRSGNYVQALERVIPDWVEWMNDRGVTTLEAVDSRDLARYAGHLARRVNARRASNDTDGITAATAWNYYSLVSAYLHYCQQWEYISENPADTDRAKDEMPDRPSTDSGQQQFWSTKQRETIVSYVDEQAYEAIDANPRSWEALTAARNRALVYVIGFSGVRGAEVLAASRDDRRTGITWGDVDTDQEVLTVLGKSQQIEKAPLTDRPVGALSRWQMLLDPPVDAWPVFPSFHLASLRDAARSQLQDRGVDSETIDTVTSLATTELVDAFRERELTPPTLTTEGGRYTLKKLSQAAAVDCSGDSKGYLTLHGARRGVGEAYYDEAGFSDAQRVLRHEDPSTTSKMYAHKEASELSDVGSDIFSADE